MLRISGQVLLEEDVHDGIRVWPGPHTIGWVTRPTPDSLQIRLVDTTAGREAAGLLADQLLDVQLSSGWPPKIRLM